MDFKQRLVQNLPRDRSGARSSDRFVYQQNWALCRILDLHSSDSDYVLTFDHHEDVTELDSEPNPTAIKGYQVKTKTQGNWTVAALMKREKGEGESAKLLPSIIGKLYTLKAQFPQETNLLQFVSNAYVSVKLNTGKKEYASSLTKFEDLDSATQDGMREELRKELQTTQGPELSSLLEFALSNIPLQDHVTHAKGKLVNFLENLYPGRRFDVGTVHRSLLSEVAVRNNNQDDIQTFEELLRCKSISRERFESLLKIAGVRPTEIDWAGVEGRLNSEGAPFSLVRAMGQEWEGVLLDRVANRDVVRLRLDGVIKDSCRKQIDVPRLLDQIEAVFAEVTPALDSKWGFSEIYLKTRIVMALYEPD